MKTLFEGRLKTGAGPALMAAALCWVGAMRTAGQDAVLPPDANAGNGQSPPGAILGSSLPRMAAPPTMVVQPVLTTINSGASAGPGGIVLPPTAVAAGAPSGNTLPPGAQSVKAGVNFALPAGTTMLPPGALPPSAILKPVELKPLPLGSAPISPGSNITVPVPLTPPSSVNATNVENVVNVVNEVRSKVQ
jgi:hypothetical protein